ncbi:hypothetical protein HR060_03230 [Catenovulum sp. SM1970]|uniref:hypothetical protein n=1 Tax=Marinifaba aquimaris TaxID=2741323 RepID=UPI001574AE51|nr:hypothetical protein [Marinifaba aquimaris]NTS75870.1 hypothetical protein [Marinifaba aquimaris]
MPTNLFKKQQGSGIVLAIFLILVMSLLATALIRQLSSTNESVAVEVFGTRALMAANIGVEVMASNLFPIDATATSSDDFVAQACPATNPIQANLPAQQGMENCSYSVSCALLDENVNNQSVRFYRIISLGQCDVGDWQTSRTVQVEAKVL